MLEGEWQVRGTKKMLGRRVTRKRTPRRGRGQRRLRGPRKRVSKKRRDISDQEREQLKEQRRRRLETQRSVRKKEREERKRMREERKIWHEYIKTCRSTIKMKHEGKMHKVINTEILRYFKLTHDTDGNKLYNGYLRDILSKIQLLYVAIEEDKRCGQKYDKKVFIGELKLKNIVRDIVKGNETEMPTELEQYEPKIEEMYICKVTEEYKNNPNKIASYPLYFVDILLEKKQEEKYWKRSKTGRGGEDFMYEDEEVIIVPDIISNSFYPNNVDEWNELKNLIGERVQENKEVIYSFLHTIKFVLFIKDPKVTDRESMVKYRYRDIFSFVDDEMGNEKLELLKRIKNKVKEFYNKNFFMNRMEVNEDFLDIYMNTDTKYNFVVISLGITNKYEYSRYVSFIELYRTLKLDDLISTLEHRATDKLVYFTRLPKEKATEEHCGDNYKWLSENKLRNDKEQLQKGGDIRYEVGELRPIYPPLNKLDYIFGQENIRGEEIKVLVEYNTGNRVHSYCSQFLLIKIREKIYEISIKSITMKALVKMQGRIKGFRKRYNEAIRSIISRKRGVIEYKYMGGYKQRYMFEEMPAVVEIYVNEVKTVKIVNRRYVMETAEEYKTKVLPKIKKANINLSIVIPLVWTSELRRIKKNYYEGIKEGEILRMLREEGDGEIKKEVQEFYNITQKLLKNPYIGRFIMDRIVNTENYTIEMRMYDNNIKEILMMIYILEHDIMELELDDINKILKEVICKNTTYMKEELVLKTKPTISEFKKRIYRYIEETSQLHLFWYNPKELAIKNYREFEGVIDKLNDKLLSIVTRREIEEIEGKTNVDYMKEYIKVLDEYEKTIDSKEYLSEMREYIKKSSNFYDLYRGEFKHNIRELREKDKEEITRILRRLYEFRVNELDIKDEFDGYFHYPNKLANSVLHMQIYPNNYGMLKDKFNNYYDIISSRMMLWDKKAKYELYNEKDMLLLFAKDTNEKLDDSKIKKIAKLYGREELFRDS